MWLLQQPEKRSQEGESRAATHLLQQFVGLFGGAKSHPIRLVQVSPEGCSSATGASCPHTFRGTRDSNSLLVSPTDAGCPFHFGSCQVLLKCFSNVPLVTF